MKGEYIPINRKDQQSILTHGPDRLDNAISRLLGNDVSRLLNNGVPGLMDNRLSGLDEQTRHKRRNRRDYAMHR
ncbi:MAG: hypothetical protein GX338_09475 [Firmicutes bacterium]|nr:hypothetical protein [Bacillota bacterium]